MTCLKIKSYGVSEEDTAVIDEASILIYTR